MDPFMYHGVNLFGQLEIVCPVKANDGTSLQKLPGSAGKESKENLLLITSHRDHSKLQIEETINDKL